MGITAGMLEGAPLGMSRRARNNGAAVAGYNKAAVVTAGKLKSLDGVYGLRFAHNTEVTVTGLTMTTA